MTANCKDMRRQIESFDSGSLQSFGLSCYYPADGEERVGSVSCDVLGQPTFQRFDQRVPLVHDLILSLEDVLVLGALLVDGENVFFRNPHRTR